MPKHIFLLFTLLLIGSNALAQTLEENLLEAGENNPALRAYFNNYLAAMEKVPQVGSLPDPELSFGYFIEPMEFRMGRQRAELTLMQMFPWFGMLGSQKGEAEKMAIAQYEAFREAKNQLYFAVKENWFRLQQVESQIKFAEENLEILQSLERIAIVRFQSASTNGSGSGSMQEKQTSFSGNQQSSNGGMNGMRNSASSANNAASSNRDSKSTGGAMPASGSEMADVLRIQIEIKAVQNEIVVLQASKKPLVTKFNQLLNRSLEEEVVVNDTLTPTQLPINIQPLEDSIAQKNPMLKMLDAESEAYDAQREMAKFAGRPMFGVGLNYMIFSPVKEGEMAMGGNNMFMPMVSLTLPIYRRKHNARAKEVELMQESIAFQKTNTINDLKVQWEESLEAFRNTERNIKLYNEQAQLADQALELMITSYASNGSSFEEILRLQQQLLKYKLQLVDELALQNIMVAKLEMLSVADLD